MWPKKCKGKIFAGVDVIVCVLLFLQRILKMKGNRPQEAPSRSDNPTVQRFPPRSRGIIQIIHRFRTKHHDLGIWLLHDDYGNISDAIEAQYRPDPNRITEAIFQK